MHKVCDRLINTPRNFPAHSAANSPICGLMSFPDRQTVLDFLKENPAATSKADIAKGLKVKGRERAILREVLAAAELLFVDEVPPKVSIQEGIRLAEQYGGPDSPRFVNGVLDALYKGLDEGAR